MMSIRFHKTSLLAGALALAIVGLGASTATAGSVAIQEVFVDVDAGTIRIVGRGFGTEPEVTLGTFEDPLYLMSVDDGEILAELPYGIEDGQYLLLVMASPTASSATGCVDGKPKALTFEYTGDSCLASSNPQEGKFECAGDAAYAEPVGVGITKHGEKTEVVPGDESIWVGDSVTLIATGKRLKSSTQLSVVQDGSVFQSLNIHTSCSKPLSVGDQFGSLRLTGFFLEGTDESTLRPGLDEFDMVITGIGGGGGSVIPGSD